MNQGIPKAARELLARQRPAGEHPSADMLNGYVEQSVTAEEKSRVTNHLAACVECREVVFLASAAAEERRDLAVAAAARLEQVAAAGRSKAGWSFWRWAAPALAAVVVVAGVLIERNRIVSTLRPASTRTIVASRQPAPPAPVASQATGQPATQPQAAVSATAAAKYASSGEARAAKRAKAPVNPVLLAQQNAALEVAPAGAVAGLPLGKEERKSLPPPASQTVEVTSAAPLVSADSGLASAFVNTPTSESLTAGTAGMGKAAAPAAKPGLSNAVQLGLASHPQWRISGDGHLERSLTGNDWTRVLAGEIVSFRVVSVMGNDIWAGGSGGALFHSSDGGLHWKKVVLGADGEAEHGTVISIRFDTVLQGDVGIDSGASWSTSDGGQIWSRH
ncbi:MAG TPA: hypothetical protein VL240_09215 [Candidatus Binatia bacterium]|nr:hypothetical protein [Candidatus Binatia bacterium]